MTCPRVNRRGIRELEEGDGEGHQVRVDHGTWI